MTFESLLTSFSFLLQVTWRTAYSQDRMKNITEVAPTRLRQSRYYIEVSIWYPQNKYYLESQIEGARHPFNRLCRIQILVPPFKGATKNCGVMLCPWCPVQLAEIY